MFKKAAVLVNSCFRSTESGEWTNSDKTALNAFY